MLTNDSLWSAGGRTKPTTRRRLLHMAATVAATAPLAALTAGGNAQASPETPATAPRRIRRAVLVPRFGGDATSDWYPTALRQLAGLGIRTEVVSLLPEPTAPGIDETVAAIARAVGDDPPEIAQTLLIGHSVGSRALLAYLSRHGAHRTFAGLTSAAGPITVLLSDNDPYTADWRANAADWLGKLGAAVHIAHGAGHYMTTSPGPILDTIRVVSADK